MWSEFKAFIMRGNVLDLAIAVIIGVAFGAVITSLVNDILMPPIGLALGHADFRDLFVTLNGQTYESLKAARDAGAPVIAFGQFFNTIINFLIVAFVIFMIVRQMNRFKKPVAAAAVSTRDCPYCATTIPVAAIRCPNCTSDLRA